MKRYYKTGVASGSVCISEDNMDLKPGDTVTLIKKPICIGFDIGEELEICSIEGDMCLCSKRGSDIIPMRYHKSILTLIKASQKGNGGLKGLNKVGIAMTRKKTNILPFKRS